MWSRLILHRASRFSIWPITKLTVSHLHPESTITSAKVTNAFKRMEDAGLKVASTKLNALIDFMSILPCAAFNARSAIMKD
jgi:hypothetical protein